MQPTITSLHDSPIYLAMYLAKLCAVCGKETASKSIVHCSGEHCPNKVHTNCLDSNTTLDFCHLISVRATQGTYAPVVFHEAKSDTPHGEAVPSD